MAGFSLFTKILADFLFGLYLLNSLLNHATNLIHTVVSKLKKPNGNIIGRHKKTIRLDSKSVKVGRN